MIINYNIDKLKNTLRDFSNVTGVNIQLLKEDFSSFGFDLIKNDFCLTVQSCKEGRTACHNCDILLLEKCRQTKKAQMHTCHAGLVDIAVPILYEENILGYIILGQMKNKTDFADIENNINKYSIDILKMEKHYNSLLLFDYDKIESIAKIATMLTKYIMLENMLKPTDDRNVDKVISFIEENLDKNLTVEYISKCTNLSKSVIYKDFRNNYNCTLKEFVNKKRIEKSIRFLENTNMSIEEISAKAGFSSSAYYAALFKKAKGLSPLKYRKKHEKA